MGGAGAYFMEQAGLATSDAFDISIGQSAMALAGTISSWFMLPHFGRRTIYLYGQLGILVILLAIGGLGIPEVSSSVGWASGALLLILAFVNDASLGPVCYSLVAEMPSSRLRIKTVVVARAAYNASGIVTSTLQARFINPTAWNWRGKTAFFWAGTNLLGVAWTYFRLPEPKGLTYADIDVLFERNVPARRFRQVTVEPYRSDNLVTVPDQEAGERIPEKV